MGGLTKAGLADLLYEKMHSNQRYSKNECLEIIELALETIKKGIIDDGKLKVSGFGVFEVKEKRARRGRNPQTGEELTITPRRVLTFSPSAKLKDRANAGV